MSVDLKRGETLPIHINMTFPALPCDSEFTLFIKYYLHFLYIGLFFCNLYYVYFRLIEG
jgi:hypothetical protein